MRLVIFETTAEKQKGLIGLRLIPQDTLFIFPNIQSGIRFHARGVLEPFEIYFLDKDDNLFQTAQIIPPLGEIRTPIGTITVIEAKVGTLKKFGIMNIEKASSYAKK